LPAIAVSTRITYFCVTAKSCIMPA